MAHEFARAAADIVWRRTKLGLRMDAAQIAALQEFMDQNARGAPLTELRKSHGA